MPQQPTFSPDVPTCKKITAKFLDGTTLKVFNSPKGAFLPIEVEGPTDLLLHRKGGWEGIQVKPASARAQFKAEEDELRLKLVRDRPVLIEGPNNLLVSILAKPPVSGPPVPAQNGRLIRFSGAQVHTPGLIELEDNDVLWIDPGAWVLGQVAASGRKNLFIGGRGVLENPPSTKGQKGYRTLLLDNCQDITISGIHMLTTHGWMVTLGNCERVLVSGISQDSRNGGTDGIDIVGSRNVRVCDCFLLNGDDCIAVKAMDVNTQKNPPVVGLNEFSGDWTGPVEDLLVEDCAFFNDHGGTAMEVGYETRTSRISGVTFRNIDVMAVHSFGSVFGIHAGDRAAIEDILWEDIIVEHHFDMLVDFRILDSRWNIDQDRGHVNGVRLRRIRVTENQYNQGYTISVIGGWDPEHIIRNVTFEDFRIDHRHILTADDLCLYTKQAEGIVFK